MKKMKKTETYRLVTAGLLTAIGVILPIILRNMTPLQAAISSLIPGQQIGAILLPMHLPVLLCGFICGWKYGIICGLIIPFLTNLFNGGVPPIPVAISMAFELAAYGGICGFLNKKKLPVFISLISAMLVGRVVMGIANVIINGLEGNPYGIKMYLTGAFIAAWPGIIIQLILIPIILTALKKSRFLMD